MSFSNGFGQGFTSNSIGVSNGFNFGFFKPTSSTPAATGALFTNFDSYITNGTRALHGAGQPALQGAVTRSNITITSVLKATSTVTVQGFKFVRTPEASGNWTVTTNDNMDLVLTVKSGGSINGGALSTKTFATNSKVRSATRTALTAGQTVNTYRTEYDVYTVYDANAVTLTAGTYQIVYRATSTQIGIALFNTAVVPIPTTANIYPDPADAANTTYYPVIEILETAP